MGLSIWKDVKGYEGRYMVSDQGHVKSLGRKTWNGKVWFNLRPRILKPTLSSNKRRTIYLSKDGVTKNRLIYQLVAESFLGHNVGGHSIVVDHINNICTDDRLKNLQLLTNRQNCTKEVRGVSKYVGVCRMHGKWWQAAITTGTKKEHIGIFKSEYKAHLAYQTRRREIESG